VTRAADISTEIKRRKLRNYVRLLNGFLAFVAVVLIVVRANGGINAAWPAVLSPILIVGGIVLLNDFAIVIASAWHLGCILVAREEQAARKSVTVRNVP
jgi:hypothetical protein